MLSFATALETFLGALAIVLLISGIDDLVPFFTFLTGFLRKKCTAEEPAPATERRIAIYVPCWRESAVIGNMVRHNLSAIRYRNYDFFLGVYPNDADTINVAEQLASEFSNVHYAVCANSGPTSKADCLNNVYFRMQRFEEENGVAFDTIVLHDAEDLIHPQAFHTINRKRVHYEMVQIPVLPLPTGFSDVTHGVYCDEFSEYQLIDMRAREISRSFVPSNGVGTGFARQILDHLAEKHERPFDPASLTEDYEIGVTIHELGLPQTFAPLVQSEQGLIATREYFPRNAHAAIRQRSRWITGIALQTWERHGWRGSLRTKYWFWRDRKGLVTNPISVVANLVFLVGVLDYVAAKALHHPWHFTVGSSVVANLCTTTLTLQWFRIVLRSCCVGKLYGWQTAAGVILRVFHANMINSAATYYAVRNYIRARRKKHVLAWSKTDHHYPQRDTLSAHRRNLADVLVGQGYLTEEQIAEARANSQVGATLDILLLANRLIDEKSLCKAMSLQSGLPAARLDARKISRHVLRGLPQQLREEHRIVPFAVKSGKLLVATASVPTTQIFDRVQAAAALPIEFQLVTPTAYNELCELA